MEQEQIYKKVREIVSKYTKYPEIVLSGDVDDIFLTGEKIGLDLYDMVYLYNGAYQLPDAIVQNLDSLASYLKPEEQEKRWNNNKYKWKRRKWNTTSIKSK